jgi:hypothetical protein
MAKYAAKDVATLYVGAFLQFTTGPIVWSGLWLLMSPCMLGAAVFKFNIFVL